MIHEPVAVGVMHVLLIIPESRSLKDKRRVLLRLTERIKNRFSVSCHLVGGGEHPGKQRVVFTTGGKDKSQIQTSFDKLRAFLDSFGLAWPSSVDVEYFSWLPGNGPMEM